MKKILDKKFDLWRYLSNFWTAIFVMAILWDFICDNAITSILEIMAFIYIGVLAVYVGQKEFSRWYSSHHSKYPGEWFVLCWTFLVAGVLVFDFILNKPYHLPNAVISAYVAVLTILAVTEKSKSMHRRKKRN
ncbi:MAG TPA: hypothetical protein PKI61_04200 [bacterium]|nr:hypothetical protein [bacterium]HPT30024.1 hypothetical protein [bacterium]